MPDPATPAPSAVSVPVQLKAKRTAMLVIHGIGEQNPYETLDSFARGLAGYLRSQAGWDCVLQPNRIQHDDWVEVMIRLQEDNKAGETPEEFIDLYEYYWASCTEGKISYRQVLTWLIKTDLSPLQHLTENLQLVRTATGKNPWYVLFRELIRIVFLYLPLLVLLAWMVAWVPGWTGLPTPATAWKDGALVSFVVLAFLLVGAGLLVRALHRVKSDRNGPCPYKKGEGVWLLGEVLLALVVAAIGVAIAAVEHVKPSTLVRVVVSPLAITAALWGIYLVMLYFMTKYVGDIALYVNADQKAESYAVRCAILRGSTEALTRILKDSKRDYDQVILAGHSLGSVIGYDTIDELLNQSAASPDQLESMPHKFQIRPEDLEKVRGFVTFGSPLDKVYYFFREHVAEKQVVRAQILSYLHSFRKIASERDYTPYTFEKYTSNKLPQLKWLNAWARMDIISGELHFYHADARKKFSYWLPVLSHLWYWGDPDFYQFVGEHLLVANQPANPERRGASAG